MVLVLAVVLAAVAIMEMELVVREIHPLHHQVKVTTEVVLVTVVALLELAAAVVVLALLVALEKQLVQV